MHQKLAAAIQKAIRQGALPPGSRLPSERLLSQELVLSRTTVLTAYENLRAAGWIESRAGSGTWICDRSATVQRARLQAYSEKLAESPLLNILLSDDDSVLDFTMGTPFALTELPEALTLLTAAEQSILLGERNYMPMGLPALRESIAAYYTRDGLATAAEQILVTGGAQQAIALIAGLHVQRGDTVLVESPTYFGALDAFRLAGARLATVCVGAEHVEADELRDRLIACSPRLIYLTPTYQNPTGAVMPEAARKRIGQIAREFGVVVIEDGTLVDLTLDGIRPHPIALQANAGNVLTIGSLSKLFWPGLRVGWVRGPAHIVSQLARVKCALELGSALLTQSIAVKLLTYTTQARKLRADQLRPRRDLLVRLLRERLPEWRFQIPMGGLFLWVRLPGFDSRQFSQIAARHGIAIAPGPTLSADGSETEYLRIPFLQDELNIELGVERLVSAWKMALRAEPLKNELVTVMV